MCAGIVKNYSWYKNKNRPSKTTGVGSCKLFEPTKKKIHEATVFTQSALHGQIAYGGSIVHFTWTTSTLHGQFYNPRIVLHILSASDSQSI